MLWSLTICDNGGKVGTSVFNGHFLVSFVGERFCFLKLWKKAVFFAKKKTGGEVNFNNHFNIT